MPSRTLVRLLYNHNPFYVLSSCFVLYGLAVAFRDRPMTEESSWLLARLLGGYTLLTAATASLVIRLGRVWEDARSLLLLVLLQFFALSVSFDLTCVTLPETAYQVLLAGFCFACATTEGLLRSLRLQLSRWFRGPFYAALGLLFFYPLITAEAARTMAEGEIAWRIFGFGLAAGVVSLGLVPAAIQGRRGTGGDTPWTWPWYPWYGFVFLGGALAFRVYILNLSFSPVEAWRSSFSGVFLAPLAFAWTAVLFALALADGKRWVAGGVLWAAPLLLLLTSWSGDDYWQRKFLAEFSAAVGSPIAWSLGGLFLLYSVAWNRGVSGAEWGATAMLLFATCCDPRTGWLERPTFAAPLLVAGAWHGVRAVQCGSSARLFAAAGCCLLAALIGVQARIDEKYLLLGGLQGLMVIAMAIGWWFDDAFARALRATSAGMLVAGGIGAVSPLAEGLPTEVRLFYPLAAAVLGVAYGTRLRDRLQMHAAAINGGCAVTFMTLRGIHTAGEQLGRDATLLIAAGGGCFAIAAVISAAKGGGIRRAWGSYLDWIGVYAAE